MCLPRNSAPFLAPSSRQRARLLATSRIPTVIWVGRRSLIGTGLTTGSRTVLVTGDSWATGEVFATTGRGQFKHTGHASRRSITAPRLGRRFAGGLGGKLGRKRRPTSEE